ncbi:hypothetical protein [endosymbiont GvMRE of Glomus versiforme]|uniref:hypothetical protein n=1 Tax=endosymbiont GvMRE of Glomus versiforme TaxID=2039283 RepID=UPI000ED24955|nr:hypothetical protein [endosymbiont GvMRE of Glomus versiforme]RHZ36866.1 hypothetical protein GvMRE_I2g50 [endosymbiont GvMRE of Glomus versiforme]
MNNQVTQAKVIQIETKQDKNNKNYQVLYLTNPAWKNPYKLLNFHHNPKNKNLVLNQEYMFTIQENKLVSWDYTEKEKTRLAELELKKQQAEKQRKEIIAKYKNTEWEKEHLSKRHKYQEGLYENKCLDCQLFYDAKTGAKNFYQGLISSESINQKHYEKMWQIPHGELLGELKRRILLGEIKIKTFEPDLNNPIAPLALASKGQLLDLNSLLWLTEYHQSVKAEKSSRQHQRIDIWGGKMALEGGNNE